MSERNVPGVTGVDGKRVGLQPAGAICDRYTPQTMSPGRVVFRS